MNTDALKTNVADVQEVVEVSDVLTFRCLSCLTEVSVVDLRLMVTKGPLWMSGIEKVGFVDDVAILPDDSRTRPK